MSEYDSLECWVSAEREWTEQELNLRNLWLRLHQNLGMLAFVLFPSLERENNNKSVYTNLQEVVAEPLVVFQSWPAGEVACPEMVGAISIWKEVIVFHRPIQGRVPSAEFYGDE